MSKVYAYYPGCSGLGSSKEYEQSTRAILKALGVEIQEVPDWSCCGSTPAHTVDHRLSSALAGRNLAQAERMGVEFDSVITPCPSCLTNLKHAAHYLEKPEFKEQVNKLLDRPLQTVPKVKSVLQVVYEDIGPEAIKAKVVKPLSTLKLAPYYGCIMNRPPDIMDFDHHEHPVALDELMEAIGAKVTPFPLKVECCGASYGVARNDIVMKLSGKLLDTAEDKGANAVVTACPLCQMNLDLRQDQINAANKTRHNKPVFYFTQLLGLALGLSEKEVGLDMLCVKPYDVLKPEPAAVNKEAAEATA